MLCGADEMLRGDAGQPRPQSGPGHADGSLGAIATKTSPEPMRFSGLPPKC
jgi:hypothetical protein